MKSRQKVWRLFGGLYRRPHHLWILTTHTADGMRSKRLHMCRHFCCTHCSNKHYTIIGTALCTIYDIVTRIAYMPLSNHFIFVPQAGMRINAERHLNLFLGKRGDKRKCTTDKFNECRVVGFMSFHFLSSTKKLSQRIQYGNLFLCQPILLYIQSRTKSRKTFCAAFRITTHSPLQALRRPNSEHKNFDAKTDVESFLLHRVPQHQSPPLH